MVLGEDWELRVQGLRDKGPEAKPRCSNAASTGQGLEGESWTHVLSNAGDLGHVKYLLLSARVMQETGLTAAPQTAQGLSGGAARSQVSRPALCLPGRGVP